MRKFLLFAALFLAAPVVTKAQSGVVWDKGYSTFTVTGVYCTTGTAVQLNGTRQVQGFVPALYVLDNNDSADTAYIGHDVSVSTFTDNAAVLARRGFPLRTAAQREFKVGLNPQLTDQPDVELWCKAADAGGAAAVLISLMTFGWR